MHSDCNLFKLQVAKLVGMQIIKTGETIEDEIETLKANWNKYDFFFVHVKKTDSYGEDGNFNEKVKVIENTDRVLKDILALKPDVLIITGDHSTPAPMKSHSWHPVPVLINSKFVRKGLSNVFDEFECARGVLGTISALDLFAFTLAHAENLKNMELNKKTGFKPSFFRFINVLSLTCKWFILFQDIILRKDPDFQCLIRQKDNLVL